CNTSREVTVSVDDRPATLICGDCGGTATRQFSTRTTFRLGSDPHEAAYRRGEMATSVEQP
ncbi:MAG: hypothetical protein IID15_02660, partial [Candidatus Marinimicrobia bacterium]|nr:hypothetical protein [Candidatus Neomarinimicrobiota bacterium]